MRNLPAGVPCHREHCDAPATKSCARCRLSYYCSRECQVRDYPQHKAKCQEMASQEERATGAARPLDSTQAEDLVAAVARQLEGQGAAAASAGPSEEQSPMKQLQALAGLSFKNEKLLGKAGACEILASAFDRALAAADSASLYEICTGMTALTATCAKNRAAFGRLGVIAGTTKALMLATRGRDWPLAGATSSLLAKLALNINHHESSQRAQFFQAEAFGALAKCIVAAARAPELGAPASYLACDAMHDLEPMSACCGMMFSVVPGLGAALERCLHAAVTAAAAAITHAQREPERLRDAVTDVKRACNGIFVIARWPGVCQEQVDAIATPRLCQDLRDALAMALSPEYRRERPRCDPAWWLARYPTRVAYGLCCCHINVPPDLRPAGDSIVDLLKAANREGDHPAQCDAALGVSGMARDVAMASQLAAGGAYEAALEALGQAVDRKDSITVCHSMEAVRRLAADSDIARQLSSSPTACELLVRSLRVASETLAKDQETDELTLSMDTWVDIWQPMMRMHPPCKQFFLDAGALDALRYALTDVPMVAKNPFASSLYLETMRALAKPPSAGSQSSGQARH
eukprot:jgi/Mesvir1/8886/Mv02774-RA.1